MRPPDWLLERIVPAPRFLKARVRAIANDPHLTVLSKRRLIVELARDLPELERLGLYRWAWRLMESTAQVG